MGGGQFQEHTFQQKKDFLGVSGVSKTLRAGDCDTENKVIFSEIGVSQVNKFTGDNGVYGTFTNNNGTGNYTMFTQENMFMQESHFMGEDGVNKTLVSSPKGPAISKPM